MYEKVISYHPFLQSQLIIMGDFNVPDFNSFNRNRNFINLGSSVSQKVADLQEFIQVCCLYSVNHGYNYLNRTLDLVLTSEVEVRVNLDESLITATDPNHPPLCIVMPIQSRIRECRQSEAKNVGNQYLNFGRADFLSMYNKFKQINRSPIYNIKNSDQAAIYFNDTVYQVILETVPMISRRKTSYPSWFSLEIRSVLKEKEKFRLKYKKTANQAFLIKYQELRRRSKRLIKNAKETLEMKTEIELKENPKKFWSHVNKKRNQNTEANTFKYNGKYLQSPQDMADAFAQYFSSVFSLLAGNHLQMTDGVSTTTRVHLIRINEMEVKEAVDTD